MSNTIANKKLKTELRRVMSDRVLKITKFSQQQNIEKVKCLPEKLNLKCQNSVNNLNENNQELHTEGTCNSTNTFL
jgi:hypothetical protein